MALLPKTLRLTRIRQWLPKPLAEARGNILVYVVLVMVIFGLLGVMMLSLFGTSISSSATRNNTRRAFYMAESGIRYGVSQLRDKDFGSQDIDDLNTTTFKLPPGEFKINVFGPWFESPTDQSIGGSGGTLNLKVTEGKIPSGFLSQIPAGDSSLRIVNRDFINFDKLNPFARDRPAETGIAQVTGVTQIDDTTLQFSLADDFVVAKGEDLCLAVLPASAGQSISAGGNFDLSTAARSIFPRLGGAFEIRKRNFSYREAKDIGDRIQLTDIQPVSGETSLVSYPLPLSNIQSTDEGIMLSPRNHLVTAEGTYDKVTSPANASFSAAVADRSFVKAKDRKPDIEFDQEEFLDTKLREVEPVTNTSFVNIDNTERFLTIGGGTGPSLGAVWFRDTRSIGGYNRYCQGTGTVDDPNIGCFFNEGIRVFFTLEYSGSGDGLVFALINGNPNKNDTASAGGDIERSEMLGYAGDSRLNVTGTAPPNPPFLDNSGPARGLIPPKIGIEFDAKVNYSSAFESTGAYCASGTSLNANTRNDPGTPAADNRDAVQLVYWGSSALNVPCRANNPSYDDNRHDPYGEGSSNWFFDTGGDIQSSPLVAGNGTIYVGSNSSDFFALNPDGTEKWRVSSSGPWYSPALSSTGRIYAGTGASENRLYAIRDDDTSGTVLWSFPTGGAVTTKPAVGTTGNSSGIIYFGSDDGVFRAVNSSNSQNWSFTPFGASQPLRSSPAVSENGNVVYFGSDNGDFFANRADNLNNIWTQSLGGAGAYRSSPVVGPGGRVYVGNDNGRLYAFNGSTGEKIWEFNTGGTVRSSPALSNDGSVVYIGSSNGTLFARNTSDGSPHWPSPFTGAAGAIESPITVDANNHIYFGSNDNKAYALYSDGTLKWSYTTGADVAVKPAVKGDGTIYVGSQDHKLYSVNQFTNPKNRKDLIITSSGQSVGGVPVSLTSENDWLKGSSSKGPWAVRLEIARSTTPANGTYAYNLRAWMRQCSSTNCNNPLLFDPLGTFYEDTRIKYDPAARPPMIEQIIDLSEQDHLDFERFIFGFTGQTALNETQTAVIRKFQLSFIRPNDPTVGSDPGWP